MPSYDYHCTSCDTDLTVTRAVEARQLDECPFCGSTYVRRIFTPPAVNTVTSAQPRVTTLEGGVERREILREDRVGMAGYEDLKPDGTKHTTITPFGAPGALPPNVEVKNS